MKFLDEGYTILTFKENEDEMEVMNHCFCETNNVIMLEAVACHQTVAEYLEDSDAKYVSYLIDNENCTMLFKVTCSSYIHLCTDYYPVPLDIGTSTANLIDELVADDLAEKIGPKKAATLLSVLGTSMRS